MGWVVNAAPWPLYPQQRDPSAPNRNSIPGPSSPKRVTILTALSWPMLNLAVRTVTTRYGGLVLDEMSCILILKGNRQANCCD